MVWFYRLWVIAALLLLGISNDRGWRSSPSPAQIVPPSVRSSPGGYRSYHFWHTGYSGGK